MIRNEKGEVVAAILAKVPPVGDSEIHLFHWCNFSELVNEGDNANVMKSISSTGVNQSRLGHIIEDIRSLAHGLRWVNVSAV